MGYSYVPLKLKAEVMRIKKACRKTVEIVEDLCRLAVPGVTSRSLSDICEEQLKKNGAEPALKGYKGFPAPVCISVNHVAAHGIPNDYELQNGDIITIDLIAGMNGWYGDYAVTIGIGKITEERKKLIEAAKNATEAGNKCSKSWM